MKVTGIVTANRKYSINGGDEKVYFEVEGMRLVMDRDYVGELPPKGFYGQFHVLHKWFKSKTPGEKPYCIFFLQGWDEVMES